MHSQHSCKWERWATSVVLSLCMENKPQVFISMVDAHFSTSAWICKTLFCSSKWTFLDRIYLLNMTTTMFLVPYTVPGLTLPPSRGGVSVSSWRHEADFCDCLNFLSDFWAPVLKAEQLLPGSLTPVSVLQRPRGDREVPGAPALPAASCWSPAAWVPVARVSQPSDDSSSSHYLPATTWQIQMPTTLPRPANSQVGMG